MLLQIYITPAMWWPLHVYWVSILMVLVVLDPGGISVDALIRAPLPAGIGVAPG